MKAKDKKLLARIERAMCTVAKIIKNPRHDGTVYKPFFERLKSERDEMLDFERDLDAAIARIEEANAA